MKPTDEQIKRFWEKCGVRGECKIWDCFNKSPENCSVCPYWEYPPIDLNNLFEYAVPKLIKTGHWLGMITTQLSSGTQYTFAIYVEKYRDKAEHKASDKDPALALFWAIYKAWGLE